MGLSTSARSNRLVLPHPDKPEHPANLSTIVRWANSQTVNQVVAGTGVTIDTQTLSGPDSTGANGTGIVTINSSGSFVPYASLLGPGETSSPGALTQDGDLTVLGKLAVTNSGIGGINLIDNTNNGINLTDNGTAGINLLSSAHKITITASGYDIDLDSQSGGINLNSGGGQIQISSYAGGIDITGAVVNISGNAPGAPVQICNTINNTLSFFAVTPVVQQATPVTLADVIALLQAYGLSA